MESGENLFHKTTQIHPHKTPYTLFKIIFIDRESTKKYFMSKQKTELYRGNDVEDSCKL